MKILLASSSPTIIQKFIAEKGIIDVAETGEEIFQLLENNDYDCLFTEAQLLDIDVWSLANFINSNVTTKTNTRLPIFVLEEENVKQPKLLAANYGIKTITLSETIDLELLVKNSNVDTPTVLVIEDDLNTANGMQITLRKEYQVDVCNTGSEGLLCWKEKRQDLILLDLMLPGTSGEDVLNEIRSISPSQAIIIVSARCEKEIQQKLILLGANDYLTKPFTPNALNKTCRVILTQVLYQQELSIKDTKLNYIASELLLALDALEDDETESAINIMNKIIYSMTDKLVSEDFSLGRIIHQG
jgi:DNA-binding response OmpR family regulator